MRISMADIQELADAEQWEVCRTCGDVYGEGVRCSCSLVPCTCAGVLDDGFHDVSCPRAKK